ncbi:hypothetical protein ACLB2K_055169 [Fragaria x ananassa]
MVIKMDHSLASFSAQITRRSDRGEETNDIEVVLTAAHGKSEREEYRKGRKNQICQPSPKLWSWHHPVIAATSATPTASASTVKEEEASLIRRRKEEEASPGKRKEEDASANPCKLRRRKKEEAPEQRNEEEEEEEERRIKDDGNGVAVKLLICAVIDYRKLIGHRPAKICIVKLRGLLMGSLTGDDMHSLRQFSQPLQPLRWLHRCGRFQMSANYYQESSRTRTQESSLEKKPWI